jgi:hypothetical protein
VKISYIFLSFCLMSGTPLLGQWQTLFNGKDLQGWTPKITGYEAGENFANTYRVDNGAIVTAYDGYEQFNNRFGVLFYEKPYSHYRLRLRYRFFGEQARGAESWAWRNSGLMIHSQSPQSMGKDQDFPISLEVQFLGGNGTEERPTGNLCTPGMHVDIDGQQIEEHCIPAKAKTYHGDRWVKAEVLVLGDSLIQHIFEGKAVISYARPVIGGGVVSRYDPKVKVDGQAVSSGYIALQSESHSIAFKKIQIQELDERGKPVRRKSKR